MQTHPNPKAAPASSPRPRPALRAGQAILVGVEGGREICGQFKESTADGIVVLIGPLTYNIPYSAMILFTTNL